MKISMLQYSCKNHFTTLILVKMYQIQITTGMSRGTQNCWYLILVIVYLDTCQLKRKTNFLLFQEFSVSPAHSCKAEYNIINKSAHFNWIRYYYHYISMYSIHALQFRAYFKSYLNWTWNIKLAISDTLLAFLALLH